MRLYRRYNQRPLGSRQGFSLVREIQRIRLEALTTFQARLSDDD